MTQEWQPIETAPKDRLIQWKRVHKGKEVASGIAKWRDTHWHWPRKHPPFGFAMPVPTHWRDVPNAT